MIFRFLRFGSSALVAGMCFLFFSCSTNNDGEMQKSDIAGAISQQVEEDSDTVSEPIYGDGVVVSEPTDFEFNTDIKKDYLITIHTAFGDMSLVLYDETINHKKNFVKLASEGFYDSTAFHRVIEGFMIQGGDPNSKTDNTRSYGQGGPGYTVPGEFNSKFIHKKGALAAARTGDQFNPQRASSGSQFYIVHGQTYSESQLNNMYSQKVYNAKFARIKELINLPENSSDLQQALKYQQTGQKVKYNEIIGKYDSLAQPFVDSILPGYTDEQLAIYQEIGGTPSLDMEYTVYGEVVSGLEVIDTIASQTVGGPQNSLPAEKIIVSVTVELLKKKKITKKTGYEYL